LHWWFQQDEIAVAGNNKIACLLIGVACHQSFADQYPKVMRERRVGVIDALILANNATKVMTDCSSAHFKLGIVQNFVRRYRMSERGERGEDDTHP
jgi:hypothetical protein